MAKKKATSKITFQGIGQPSSIDNYTPPVPVFGCTNPNADNFDPAANTDDGSCIFLGCTDPQADNYDAIYNQEDGSCVYSGCTDPSSNNGITTYNHPNPGSFYTNPIEATIDDGTCQYTVVAGCTDPTADNYDPLATVDDGTCTYSIPGCIDPLASNYNPNATVDDGSCQYLGCTDPTANNYNPNATVDDGSCTYSPTTIPGCTDSGSLSSSPYPGFAANNYNPTANLDDGSCVYSPGCTNLAAFNYNSSAIQDDGSCILSYDPSFIPTTTLTTDIIIAGNVGSAPSYFVVQMVDSGSVVSPTTFTINLTQASTGWVWNSPLTLYSGSINFATDPNNLTGGDIPFTDVNGVDLGNGEVSGTITFQFTNSTGNVIHTQIENITPLDIVMGCGDSSALNFDPSINFNLSTSCIAIAYGCTDPNAINYYPGANVDDGSCLYAGCTDPNATNYNSTATIDDGSCIYPAPVGTHENITASFVNLYYNNSILFQTSSSTQYATTGHQRIFIDRTSLVSAHVTVPYTQDEPYNYVFEYAIGCGGLNPFIVSGQLVPGTQWGDENAAGITTDISGTNFYYNGNQFGIAQGSQSTIHTRLNNTTANGGLQAPVGDYFTQPSTTPYIIPLSPGTVHPSWNPNMVNGTYPVYGPSLLNPPTRILVVSTLAKSSDHPNNPNNDPVYYAFKLETFNNSGDIASTSSITQIEIDSGGNLNYTTINPAN